MAIENQNQTILNLQLVLIKTILIFNDLCCGFSIGPSDRQKTSFSLSESLLLISLYKQMKELFQNVISKGNNHGND